MTIPLQFVASAVWTAYCDRYHEIPFSHLSCCAFILPQHPQMSHYQRMYGLTPEQYLSMFEAQKGLCAACGQPETAIDARTKTIANLHVDHSHTTGEVRALLCRACNTAYGQLQEDPERIRLLLAYAEKHYHGE
jgi:hypothetical protein